LGRNYEKNSYRAGGRKGKKKKGGEKEGETSKGGSEQSQIGGGEEGINASHPSYLVENPRPHSDLCLYRTELFISEEGRGDVRGAIS